MTHCATAVVNTGWKTFNNYKQTNSKEVEYVQMLMQDKQTDS